MNKRIYIFLLVLIGFILNILLYLVSSNYRYFLQSLKYDDFSSYEVNDEFKISIKDLEQDNIEGNKDKDSIFAGLSSDFGDNQEEIDVVIEKDSLEKVEDIENTIKDEVKQDNKVEYIGYREEIKLTNIEELILEKLTKYELKQVDLHPRLFDLTGEYPHEYFEYYNNDINLYFFGNKLYSDLRDIFEVLTYELPFSINEVNNFGTQSFYINLNDGFDDGYVRVVLEKSNRIFGFKIKKELYNQIKDELAQIFAK